MHLFGNFFVRKILSFKIMCLFDCLMERTMKIFVLMLLCFLSFSCGNTNENTADDSEGEQNGTKSDEAVCAENHAECGELRIVEDNIRYVFCGECGKGLECDEDENKCIVPTRESECKNKPENAVWNDDGAEGTFVQTWNGEEWIPKSKDAVYSETPAECGFVCPKEYYWNDFYCIDWPTRKRNCPDMPENAVWNDDGADGTFIQTWNGEEWLPESHETTVGKTPGECIFMCRENYAWENGGCVTAPTRTEPCKGLPEHASWNTAESVFQTSDGFDWTPTDEGVYDETPSAEECRFVCKDSYFWSGSECVNPCGGNPCQKTENSDGVCTVFDYDVFICGCKTGFRWNSKHKQCESNENAGKVLCSGQKLCYDSSERPCEEVQGDYFGQDAHYAGLGFCIARDFSVENHDGGEGIVIDNNTGLEWQQTIEGYNNFTWDDANDYCKKLEYGGHDDWRLPTIEEFRTIIDYGGNGGGVDTSLFPVPTVCDFWTSTVDAVYGNGKHWAVDSRGGYGNNANYFEYSARCVRNSWTPSPSKFHMVSENGSKIVRDATTNLIWQGTVEDKELSWYDALVYCENLTYAGYNDWRLPNINELETLLRFDKSTGTPSDFPDIPEWRYWSSSTYTLSHGYGWGLNIQYGGSVVFVPKGYDDLLAVCVR